MKITATGVDQTLLAAVFLDVVAWKPDLLPTFERDFCRAQRIIATRGPSFLYDDLPKAGKVFDRSLSVGKIDVDSIPHSFGPRVNLTSRTFLSSLFRLVFDNSGYIHLEPSITAIFFIRQILYLYKEVEKQCPPEKVGEAIDEFIEIEKKMRKPTLSWELDHIDPSPSLSFLDGYQYSDDLVSSKDIVPTKLLHMLDSVTGVISAMIPSVERQTLRPGHGPGSVSDLQTGKDKYLFPNWPKKLDHLFPYVFFGRSREDAHLDDAFYPGISEPSARLIAVPKTPLKPRLIASEPTCHQFCQKALMRWIRKHLPYPCRISINFLSQEPSRTAALLASSDGKSATVDLSSASDRLSCWVVERVFRKSPELLEHLHSVRTRSLSIDLVGRDDVLLLKKFAAQGSAVTFPIQTIVYFLICCAVVLFEYNKTVSIRNIVWAARKIRVYGDDIILPSHCVPALDYLMTYLGLKVNGGKTHHSGKFRESCGMDAYDGVDVTPAYLPYFHVKNTLNDLASWVDTSNNCYRKGLWFLSSAIIESLDVKVKRNIPVCNRPLSCVALHTYQDGLVSSRRKWCNLLHSWKIPGYQVQDRTAQMERSTDQNLLQYFLEEPSMLIKWHAGYSGRKRKQVRLRWVYT